MSNSERLKNPSLDLAEPPSTESPTITDVETLDVISSPPHHGQGTLPLLQLAGWSKDNAYDEHLPACVHYSIEWKLIVDRKQNQILSLLLMLSRRLSCNRN